MLKGELNYRSISMREASERISTDEFVSILRYLNKSVITERGATEIVREMLDHGGTPDEIIKDKGLASIGSEDIEKAVSEVIEAHKSAVEDYKAGKTEALNFIVGQVMKQTRGRAEPKEVREFVRERIDRSADGQS